MVGLTQRQQMVLDYIRESISNHARFNPGSQNMQDANFGLVNSTLNEPRRMQLGLKLYF